MIETKLILRKKRKIRSRQKVFGTEARPRLSVFRSNRAIYAQLIDDSSRRTLLGMREPSLPGRQAGLVGSKTKSEKAYQLGLILAKEARKKKIERVVFDRGGYLYHGRVAALARGAREGGLLF